MNLIETTLRLDRARWVKIARERILAEGLERDEEGLLQPIGRPEPALARRMLEHYELELGTPDEIAGSRFLNTIWGALLDFPWRDWAEGAVNEAMDAIRLDGVGSEDARGG